MKLVAFLIFLLYPFASLFAQSWKPVGTPSGFAATETAVQITPGGLLYMACLDPHNNNRITVRKWVNNSWAILGSEAFGSGGYFDLQLVTSGENTVLVSAKTINGSNEVIEVFKHYLGTGNTWLQQDANGAIRTDHAYQYSLQAAPGGTPFLTYYNENSAYDQFQIILLNLENDQQLFSYSPPALSGTGNALSCYVESISNITAVFQQNSLLGTGLLGSSLPIKYYNGTTWGSAELSSPDKALTIQTAKGTGSTHLSAAWLTDESTPKLKYKALNGATAGTELVLLQSANLTDYALDAEGENAFLFYRNGTTCTFAQITSPMSPVAATITSGTSLAPATATSLSVQTYNGVHVIAYVDAGRCYVKEYDRPATIGNYGLYTMCEVSYFNNNGNTAFACFDPNFDHSNLVMTCTSQNTGVIPQSAIAIANSDLNWQLAISTTGNIVSTTIVDLLWTLTENGNPVGTDITPVRIYSNPNIHFNFQNTTSCENGPDILLTGKASPYGGIWSGTGVNGNFFHPGDFNPTPETSAYLQYTQTNQYGCSTTDSIEVTIFQTPDLELTITPSDCNEKNGIAAVTITGGIAPYTTYWSTGSTQTTIQELAPGQYQAYVTDNHNCLSKIVASVPSEAIGLSANITAVSCNGGANGTIDLTVNSEGESFTYKWSNGANTEDISALQAGPYEVVVISEDGCISTASFVVTQPDELTSSTTLVNPACGQSDGSVTLAIAGGTTPYTYSWVNANNQSIGGNTPDLTSTGSGFYTCTVTDAAGCVEAFPVALSNSSAPEVVIGTVVPSSCAGDGSIQLINVTGTTLEFQWSNGATTQHVSGLVSGTYLVSAMDANQCATVLSAVVGNVLPDMVPICLVTVDTITNTNRVVWETPVTDGIDHFNIYRESSQAGLYQLAGSVDYDDEATFNDQSVSAEFYSRRYLITAVDACGIESEHSAAHKSIHLAINSGLGNAVNLSWDAYQGVSYTDFTVRRYTIEGGWQVIQTMPANLFTYTDYPHARNGLSYMVTIELPQSCGDYTGSFSNRDNHLAEYLSVDELLAGNLQVFPNPTSGNVTMENTSGETVEVAIYDASGRQVSAFPLASGSMETDLTSLSNGLYQVVFTRGGATAMHKLILHH